MNREAIIEQLEIKDELARRKKLNPLKYMEQHKKQQEATYAIEELKKKLIALFWGNRCGKTEWGAQTVAKIALGKHPTITTPASIWCICPSFDAQKETTQLKLLNYIPEKNIVDRSYIRKGILSSLKVKDEFGNITEIIFKSYEQGRAKFQGAGKHLIWFDEEPPRDIWEECYVRQEAGIDLYILLTMTPINGMTWVYDEIYLNTDNSDIYTSAAGWNDNPWLTEDQKDVMSRGLTNAAIQVRRFGKFTRLTGLVCSWFDRESNVVDMSVDKLPPGDTYLGIDFGFSNYGAGLYIRIDKEDNLWIFDGWYEKGLTAPDIIKKIRLKEKNINGIIHRIGDSAQADSIKQMNDEGIQIDGVRKQSGSTQENWDEYRASKMEIYGRIQRDTQKSKIFIASSLIAIDDDGNEFNFVVREMTNLKWEEWKVDGVVKQKGRWGKQANHAIDGISYVIVTIEQPSERANQEEMAKKVKMINRNNADSLKSIFNN